MHSYYEIKNKTEQNVVPRKQNKIYHRFNFINIHINYSLVFFVYLLIRTMDFVLFKNFETDYIILLAKY